MSSRPSSYDKQPTIPLPDGATVLHGGEAWAAVDVAARERSGERAPVIAIDTYPGVDLPAFTRAVAAALPEYHVIDIEDAAALPVETIDRLIAPNLTDDRVFGVLSHLTLPAFYDSERLAAVRRRLAGGAGGADGADRAGGADGAGGGLDRPTVVIGWGAELAAPHADALVLVDLARWELQLRLRAGATNWRTPNSTEETLRKYKRGFFVEWRMADRHKRRFFDRVDFVVDGAARDATGGMVTGDAFRAALEKATTGPLRVVPFFDPGVWGGHWMQDRLDLEPTANNYAWCFDCVPEENSLLLEGVTPEGERAVVEIPAIDLVLQQPRELLGAKTFARFGAEFPIRFDFLDTVGGGNLSLQVHPLTDYIQQTFGMHYTQDESYYLLDADDDAVVYLGLKSGTDPAEMMQALRAATDGEHPFDADRFVNSYPAKKHDHFAIPAGTVHASGANSMVLEISATPFIFTFKLWDWGRLGLDGVPRPVHLEHGGNNIQWDRTTDWVAENLLDQVEILQEHPNGDREERTGLHELEFIEVRRNWFADEAAHDTEGTVNVLNLVEGDEVEVVSPTDAFPPYTVHYAETFIVPAAVGPYIIRRTATSASERFATVKASVRGTEDPAHHATPHHHTERGSSR
ncbi:class I mannose-6-phosphate isomerase [Herbiconiux sp. KACC 21604]|uniref:class I mannose-6-phosphate isomerase n=1 Tax=unclassified Herbiconiux TaxID=2618217 RepID=UPI0014929C30|nr:class I mannose-6-phosphate isomerase [Herbiconiux sp. SALV-R1]QJU55621.1 class I mannose-6-phosphate isomerase [Herbiconiux sp. SALV-R1]WPO86818.1 class I mannose-6-phosphate isomerase [Herbiconiux sp. KACC 21604]